MEKFIGRKAPLESLESLYARNSSTTCAVYGRRRTGKTTLLERFCESKRNLFLTIPGRNRDITMAAIGRRMSRFAGREVAPASVFDLVDFLEGIDGERTVVVIDEFPRLVSLFPETPALLQEYIDHEMRGQDIMLILCGSSIKGMMEVLNDAESPLFKRFPVQIRIDALRYPEARQFHPGLGEEDRIRMYAICSGMPAYHRELSDMGVREAVETQLLSATAPMRTEAMNSIAVELSPWEEYDSVLVSIENGKTMLEKISDSTGFSTTKCTKMLDNLEELRIVTSETPYGRKYGKEYRILDGSLRFFYEVIDDKGRRAQFSESGLSYESVKEKVESFYGPRFELVCRQYVADMYDCRYLGSWWGKVPVREDGELIRDANGKVVTTDTDVDIVAEVVDGSHVDLMLGECKFTHRRCGMRELEELMENGMQVRKGTENKRYVLFSRSGFTDELMEYIDDHPSLRVDTIVMDGIRAWADGDVTVNN